MRCSLRHALRLTPHVSFCVVVLFLFVFYILSRTFYIELTRFHSSFLLLARLFSFRILFSLICQTARKTSSQPFGFLTKRANGLGAIQWSVSCLLVSACHSNRKKARRSKATCLTFRIWEYEKMRSHTKANAHCS